jgi:WD40 repeat protein
MLEIWRPRAGVPAVPLYGHAGDVTAVCASAGGKYVVSGGQDGTVRLWLAAEARLLRQIEHDAPVEAVALNASRSEVLTAHADGSIRVGQGRTGQSVPLARHRGAIFALALSPDTTRLASGSAGGAIRVCDSLSGKPVWGEESGPAPVRALAWSPDGSVLAAGGEDGRVQLRDGATGDALQAHAELENVVGLAWPAPDLLVAGGGWLGRLVLWSRAGEVVDRLRVDDLTCLAALPGRLVVGCDDATVCVYGR